MFSLSLSFSRECAYRRWTRIKWIMTIFHQCVSFPEKKQLLDTINLSFESISAYSDVRRTFLLLFFDFSLFYAPIVVGFYSRIVNKRRRLDFPAYIYLLFSAITDTKMRGRETERVIKITREKKERHCRRLSK